jgi:hypothetical protein
MDTASAARLRWANREADMRNSSTHRTAHLGVALLIALLIVIVLRMFGLLRDITTVAY